MAPNSLTSTLGSIAGILAFTAFIVAGIKTWQTANPGFFANIPLVVYSIVISSALTVIAVYVTKTLTGSIAQLIATAAIGASGYGFQVSGLRGAINSASTEWHLRLTRSLKIAALVLMPLGMMAMLGGCATETPTVILYQGIGSEDLAVKASTPLVQAGYINPTAAKSLYEGFLGGSAALGFTDVAIVNGDTAAAITADMATATTDLATLLAQLQTIQSSNATLAAKGIAVRKLLLQYKASSPTASVTPAEISALAELAVELANDLIPGISDLWNTITGTTTVTQAQVETSLSGLNSDIATFGTAAGIVPATQPTTGQ